MKLTGIQGKAIVVTGAAQGIGAGIAQALAAEGARLMLGDRDAALLQVHASELRAAGAEVSALPGDLINAADCTDLVAGCVRSYGRVDALVNVAGLLRAAPVLDLSVDDFDLTFRVNTRAVFICTQAAARAMVRQGTGGVLITIASDMARIPRPLQSAYCASKAAVTHLMKCFGLELAAHGIRCASVLPGATDTAMVRALRAAAPGAPDDILHGNLDKFRLPIPLGQLASVEQVAHAVLFLLSDQAAHITLTDLVVDGGGTLGA